MDRLTVLTFRLVRSQVAVRMNRACANRRSASRWVHVRRSEGVSRRTRLTLFHFLVVPGGSSCLMVTPCALISPAASSFSFCRPAVEYRALPEDFKHQLSRRTGGNLTWHDGRGQKSAGGRAVKLLQQPGTEAPQVSPTASHHPAFVSESTSHFC